MWRNPSRFSLWVTGRRPKHSWKLAIWVLPWVKHIRGKKHENTWETRWETPRKMIGTWWVFLYGSLQVDVRSWYTWRQSEKGFETDLSLIGSLVGILIDHWDGRVASSTATERPIYGCLSNAYPVVSMNWEFSLIYDICIERQVD